MRDRLLLYGLYKQSMEGDVSYVQDRPSATSSPSLSPEALHKEQEKWDAWNANAGLSRTEAKRRYIETLIATMHRYASTTPEARELVGELEFVWDQVKQNASEGALGSGSSERSSPIRLHEEVGGGYPGLASSSVGGFEGARSQSRGRGGEAEEVEEGVETSGGLRVLSPVSQGEEEENEEEDDEEEEEEREEFVDAPVSQFGDEVPPSDEEEHEDQQQPAPTGDDNTQQGDPTTPSRPDIQRARSSRQPLPIQPPNPYPADTKWRRQISASIIKLTTEVAALREQLESRRYISIQRRRSFLGWVGRIFWFVAKLLVADLMVLLAVILWMRRRKDRRLEGAIRVLLGDAVTQVQKVSREMKVPKVPKLRGGGG